MVLALVMGAAACGALWALVSTVDTNAAAAPAAVATIDGKGVQWWAHRSRHNGAQARAEARTIRKLREKLLARQRPAYEHAARLAAALEDVSAETLIRKGRCETTDWLHLTNATSGARGPWQFLPSTWATTPLAGFSPYDPLAAALAAAWMHAHGRGGEWACQ